MIDLKRFRAYLIIEKGIGDICANGYLGSVKRFWAATGVFKPAKDDVINYMMGYHEKGYSHSYFTNTLLALEHYLAFVGNAAKFDRPRKPKRRIEDWLTEQEIARMFVFTRNSRERCILAMLAYTGIRNLELCNLLVKNINFESQTVFIKAGKGLKDGVACIAPIALNMIMEYLKDHPRQPDDNLLFTAVGPRINLKLRQDAIRKHVHKIATRAGINRRVYPHLFRHSLAMNLLLRGADLYSVKEQLRHEFISTTEIYLKSNPQILRNNYPIFVPQYVWGTPVYQKSPYNIFPGSNSYKFNRQL